MDEGGRHARKKQGSERSRERERRRGARAHAKIPAEMWSAEPNGSE